MDYQREQGAVNGPRGPANRNLHRNRSTNSERGEMGKNSCPICFNELTDIIAYQPCSHVLCFDCAVRNRVLCNKKECPVCRTECAEVVLAGHRFNSTNTTDSDERFDAVLTAARNQGKQDPFYGFLFENIGIERAYRKMLTHSCRFCDRPFTEFEELIRHVRDRHDHHYCTVCVRQLVLFTWEHKVYMYDELLRHLDEGDPLDKNIPPHPHCQLCRYRAFDKDELFKHSRQRHQMCWICDREANKVVFFKEFQDLFDHMCENHYVCNVCSRPAEAQVSSFPTKDGLDIHMAADHGGGLDPAMLFNFERHPRAAERGGRHRRDQEREDTRENTENIRPATPPPQNFNMDTSQFPTLGPNEAVSGSSSTSVTAAPSGGAGRSSDNHVAPSKSATAPNVPRYGAPKMTENEFPSLGGGAAPATSSKSSSAGSTWANGPKITAPPPPKKTAAPRTTKSAAAVAPSSFRVEEESFPGLNGPSSTAVAKHNLDWVSVPVKAKGSKQGSSNKPAKIAASTRWDALEETTESPPVARPIGSPRQRENPSPNASARSQNYRNEGAADFDTSAFPSLAAPSKKTLPGMFKAPLAKTKTSKNAKTPAPAPALHRAQKGENDLIAESLFRTSLVSSREMVETAKDNEPVPIEPPPVAKVVRAAPYKMKKDDFPTLEIQNSKARENVPDEIRMPDRIKLQKEVKSQWGHTVVQYETVYTYVPPVNAGERADSIRAKVEAVEVKGKPKTLDMFQRELLDGKITALEFWMESQRILGKKFASLMPEVVALIPSIDVQQNIFEVAKVPIYGSPQVVKVLSQCSTCKQIVKVDERDGHARIHKGAY